MGDILYFAVFLLFTTLGYFAGSYAEKRHYRSIERREKGFLNLPSLTTKHLSPDREVVESQLVTGSVVISTDYFKRVLSQLRNIFGGEMKAYESLVDRARREALLRMKEKAVDADLIVNVRLETSSLGRSANRKNAVGSVECLAYGTAIRYRQG